MLVENKYKKDLETQNFFHIFGKNPYIMILFTVKYLLAGLVIAFLLEHLIRSTNSNVNGWERYALIVFWPIMVVIFIVYFIKGLLED